MRSARQAARDARRLWRLCVENGSLDEERARAVVDGVVASGRSSGAAILSRFVRLVKADRARRTAQVESAAPLNADVRAAVQEALRRKYGSTVSAAFLVDPTLIAGLRVKIGSDVYDGTVRGGLEALDAAF